LDLQLPVQYRHGFGWFVVFIATVLVGLWYLSPRFWLVCGVYRHGFGWFVVFIATVLVNRGDKHHKLTKTVAINTTNQPKPWR
jgi:hypothetical protein